MDDDRKTRGMTVEDRSAAEALAPFFAAARADPPAPPVNLLSAILADAAEAGAARRAVPVAQRLPLPRRRAVAAGGWRGVTALAACALLGFWLGLAGSFSIDGTTLRAGTALASSEEAADPVAAFLDLAAVE